MKKFVALLLSVVMIMSMFGQVAAAQAESPDPDEAVVSQSEKAAEETTDKEEGGSEDPDTPPESEDISTEADGSGSADPSGKDISEDLSEQKGDKEPTRGDAKAAETWTVTFDPTTDPTEPLAPITIQVEDGQAIGDLLPEVPEIPGYTTFWVVNDGSEDPEKITADTIVTNDLEAAVGREKIVYTVTVIQEDGT